MLSRERIDEEIALARVDADLPASRVFVFVHQREYTRGSPASGHYRPCQEAHADDDLGLAEDEIAALNDHLALRLHRVVMYAGYGPEPESQWIFAGLMRHELEHARQWEALGDAAFLLSRLIDDVHYDRFADAPEKKYLYRAKPDEQDANAAAAGYLVGRFADAPDRLHTDEWYPLVSSYTRPEPMATLLARTVCFLFQYAELCEHRANEDDVIFVNKLEEIDAGSAALWRTLTSCP